jgi:hypothetical protein
VSLFQYPERTKVATVILVNFLSFGRFIQSISVSSCILFDYTGKAIAFDHFPPDLIDQLHTVANQINDAAYIFKKIPAKNGQGFRFLHFSIGQVIVDE